MEFDNYSEYDETSDDNFVPPTLADIKRAALSEALEIRWENMTPEAQKELEITRVYLKRQPLVEKLYTTWYDAMLEGSPEALAGTMYVYHAIVTELVSSYQLEEMFSRYDSIAALTQ